MQAMSNLLSANIDSGLMHSIGLGYHKDLQTRAAFMEVLTKILQQGTEFDTLAETVLADRQVLQLSLKTLIFPLLTWNKDNRYSRKNKGLVGHSILL